MISPYEQYYSIAPHVLHFKILGSKCDATVLNKANGDHSSKAVKGIFVGFQNQQVKGWKGKYKYNIQLSSLSLRMF